MRESLRGIATKSPTESYRIACAFPEREKRASWRSAFNLLDAR